MTSRRREDGDLPKQGTAGPAISFLVAPTCGKRDTKSKGDRAELEVMLAMTKAGYIVSKPFGENSRYDLIADEGVRLARVQVKTGRLKRGAIVVNCCSSHGHRAVVASRPYFGEIEYLAVFCPATAKVYLLPESELVKTNAHLRVDPPGNGQVKTVRWAHDFALP